MGPILAIFFYTISIISLLLPFVLIISEIKNAILVHIRVHCRKLANLQGISEHTNQEHQGLNHQAPKWLLPQSCSNCPIQKGLEDVCQPTSTQFRFEIITQCINSCCQTWFAIQRLIQNCNIMDIINIICIIHINKWINRHQWYNMVSYDLQFFSGDKVKQLE